MGWSGLGWRTLPRRDCCAQVLPHRDGNTNVSRSGLSPRIPHPKILAALQQAVTYSWKHDTFHASSISQEAECVRILRPSLGPIGAYRNPRKCVFITGGLGGGFGGFRSEYCSNGAPMGENGKTKLCVCCYLLGHLYGKLL